ncbi:MAG TPA: rod shape-determining protein [Actinomycetota bacterium]|nr:rod shape-determining protein [Actinomycetota bacterium]
MMRSGGELAIDLGTANTLVFRLGEGIVLNQPTVVAVNARNGEVLSLGDEAWEMIGRTPSHIVAVRPLRRGAITDYETTRQMIRLILKQVGVTRWSKPRALVCIPSAITEVERRAVEEATKSAGARSVTLIEEPMAAAIGAGLPTHEPIGSFVVDVGGGTTEVAMVSMGGLIARRAVRVGGFDLDEAIQKHVRREYGVAIGERAAEQVKITAGAAYPLADAPAAEIRGREILTGMPKSVQMSQEEIREAIAEPVAAMVATARECLADSPPELGHDVLERGMFLCGGGGLLRGLDMRISQECEVPVHLTDEPLETVVMGAGRCLELLPEAAGLFAAWRGAR